VVCHYYPHGDQILVSPTLRGTGIAKALLSKNNTWAIGRGCDLKVLAVTITNAAAGGLYVSSKFVATGQLGKLRVGSPLMVQPMGMELHNAG